MKVSLLSLQGDKVKDLEVHSPKAEGVSPQAVLQVLRVLAVKRRENSAVTKTRGDVRGGGKKPWRQKGTGRARQGSIRAPQWRGGGVSHGPNGQFRRLEINKKLNQKALAGAFAEKVALGDVLVLQDSSLTSGKTKDFQKLLSRLDLTADGSLVLSTDPRIVRLSRNLPGLKLLPESRFNLRDLLKARKVFILEKDFSKVLKRFDL